MANTTVGCAVIGCGVIAPTHCTSIQAVDGATLLAVCDPDPAKAHALAERFGVAAYTDLESCLQHPGLDAVNICTPSGYHAENGILAAQAGKHVLVEKPIDVSLAMADRLIAACEQAGVKLGVISQHRFAPDLQRIKADIEAGRLGPLVLGEASIKWYRTQAYYDSGTWRGTRKLDGGGALMNQSIHYIDLLQWLMGSVHSVKAATMTRTHTIEVEDVGIAILHFANGALGTIVGSTLIFPGLPERLELHGRDGTAIIELDRRKSYYLRSELGDVDPYGLSSKLQTDGEDTEAQSGAADPAAIGAALHTAQIADFVDAIRHDRLPAVTGEDARRPLEIILAIYRAAEEGRDVLLEELGR